MTFIAAFIFGAIVGSFLNVCILRLPRNESLVHPGSHCVACSKAVAWHDNIPCVSYFVLGGRCRHCHVKISAQYPAVEILTGLLFILFYVIFGFTPKGVVYLVLALALLVESVIDWRYQIIPDEITLPTIVLGLAVSAMWPEFHGESSRLWGFLQSVIGLLVGGGLLYGAGAITERILKKEAMGGGDVKLMAGLGALLGWQGVFWIIFIASFLGSIVGLYLRIKEGQERIPFGPYLAGAAFFYLFFGQALMAWYLGCLR
ncbi:MAG: prepilin peptidase [Candidatus Omnitrophica bacterium]|nr:prepilin peptidase [Candidatus Omnitrophota bacterium]